MWQSPPPTATPACKPVLLVTEQRKWGSCACVETTEPMKATWRHALYCQGMLRRVQGQF